MPSRRASFVRCVRQYCYCRERKYCPFGDLSDFGYVIKVKENSPDLLRRALSRVPVDIISTGDAQPAEKKLEVSRRILEVCLLEGRSRSGLVPPVDKKRFQVHNVGAVGPVSQSVVPLKPQLLWPDLVQFDPLVGRADDMDWSRCNRTANGGER